MGGTRSVSLIVFADRRGGGLAVDVVLRKAGVVLKHDPETLPVRCGGDPTIARVVSAGKGVRGPRGGACGRVLESGRLGARRVYRRC